MNTTTRPKVTVKNKYTLAFMLKAERVRKKKTQQEFAKMFNVSQTYYSDIELCRKRMVYQDILQKIYTTNLIPYYSLKECFTDMSIVLDPEPRQHIEKVVKDAHIPSYDHLNKIYAHIHDINMNTRYLQNDYDSTLKLVQEMYDTIKDMRDTIEVLQIDLDFAKDHMFYLLNKPNLWQRIKNIFRKNKSTEKISTNADVNSPKKSIDLSSNPNGMQ